MQFFIWADILEKVKNRGRLPIPKAATPSSADITMTEMRPSCRNASLFRCMVVVDGEGEGRPVTLANVFICKGR